MRWAFVAVKTKPLAGARREAGEEEHMRKKDKGTRERPISAKGTFKVHRALTAENKELICS